MAEKSPPIDGRFPPKNRMPEELPILRIEIEHAGGTDVTDPNGVIVDLLRNPGRVEGLSPVPGRVSDVSGGPAILYRAEDLELALTPEEMRRFLARELTPDEYFKIRGRYGMAFEWHSDFFDIESGEALQPLSER